MYTRQKGGVVSYILFCVQAAYVLRKVLMIKRPDTYYRSGALLHLIVCNFICAVELARTILATI